MIVGEENFQEFYGAKLLNIFLQSNEIYINTLMLKNNLDLSLQQVPFDVSNKSLFVILNIKIHLKNN